MASPSSERGLANRLPFLDSSFSRNACCTHICSADASQLERKSTEHWAPVVVVLLSGAEHLRLELSPECKTAGISDGGGDCWRYRLDRCRHGQSQCGRDGSSWKSGLRECEGAL